MTGLGTSGVEMLRSGWLPVVATEQERCLVGWHWWGDWLCSAGITGAAILYRNLTDSGQKMQCHIGSGSWLFGAHRFVPFSLLADKARWVWEAAWRVRGMGSWDVLHDLAIQSTGQSPSKAPSSSTAEACGQSTVPVGTALSPVVPANRVRCSACPSWENSREFGCAVPGETWSLFFLQVWVPR